MKIIIFIVVLIIGVGLYQYDHIHGFDATFNPAILFLSLMALIGVAGMIGLALTKLDNKKGYCNLGISDGQIRRYREIHNFPDPYKAMNKKSHVDDNDTDNQ